MSKDVLRAVALGIAGLVVALVLTVGAFAIAGQDISQPAGVPMLTVTPSPTAGHDRDEDKHSADPTKTMSPSVDDHRGAGGGSDDASTATEGPDDHGSGSVAGSDDDGGSGSQGSDSGSGSSGENSGSGSGSGSGSDDSGGHGDD